MGLLMETNCKATSGYLNLPLRPLEEVIAERSKDGSGLGGDETPTPPPRAWANRRTTAQRIRIHARTGLGSAREAPLTEVARVEAPRAYCPQGVFDAIVAIIPPASWLAGMARPTKAAPTQPR